MHNPTCWNSGVLATFCTCKGCLHVVYHTQCTLNPSLRPLNMAALVLAAPRALIFGTCIDLPELSTLLPPILSRWRLQPLLQT